MGYQVDTITPTIEEPVTLEQAKEQLRVKSDFTDDDGYITRLISEARDRAEKFCTRFFTVSTVRFNWNEQLPGSYPIVIPYRLVTAVNRVTYQDREGADTEIDAAEYTFNKNNNTITPGNSWPQDSVSYQVEVETDRPAEFEGVKQAILMLVTDMYENRTQSVIGQSVNENPAVKQQLAPYRDQMGL